MIRKALTILSLLGLLLSVVAWGVSFRGWMCKLGTQTLVLTNGEAVYLRHGNHPLLAQMASNYLSRYSQKAPAMRWRPTRASVTTFSPTTPLRRSRMDIWSVPLWIPTVAFVVLLPIVRLPGRRRRKRKKLGLCLKCGYDLRGSKERCPECGELK